MSCASAFCQRQAMVIEPDRVASPEPWLRTQVGDSFEKHVVSFRSTRKQLVHRFRIQVVQRLIHVVSPDQLAANWFLNCRQSMLKAESMQCCSNGNSSWKTIFDVFCALWSVDGRINIHRCPQAAKQAATPYSCKWAS